jgi:hypothetical protein
MTPSRAFDSLTIGLVTALATMTAANADGPWTLTDLQIVGFQAVSLPSRVAQGRAAEPGELNFLLHHGHRGARYVCTLSMNPRNGNLVDDRCERLRPGESPTSRLGLPEVD